MKKVIAYTDGSACVKGDRLGGFGVYLKFFKNDTQYDEYFYKGGYRGTKTGRMELTAVITAMKKVLDKTLKMEIYSDSEYVVNCVNKNWLFKWEQNEFQGIANPDLIQKYLFEFRQFLYSPVLIHIKGHQRDLTNEHILGNFAADMLADYKQFLEYGKDTIT